MDTRPIGIFDSGIGGLTVVKEVMKILPGEDIYYFGDTARVPYGNKSPETITKFSFQNTRFLIDKDVKAIVIACNTASAFSIDSVKDNFSIPVLGVIEPGAYAAARETKSGKIGIIGTEGTIASRAYEKAIKKLLPNAEILGCPCPLFVPLVEEGWAGSKVSYLVAEEYLEPLKRAGVDTLVMGCTHYPLLKKVVRDVMGPDVALINPAEETAIDLMKVLAQHNLQSELKDRSHYKYYVSDNPDKFSKVGGNFLNKEVFNIDKIDIERY
ncbi:MAG: glutamate racemase [Clostridiales bacterium]|nr:glutamate racemase [Clostridiales bacterium]